MLFNNKNSGQKFSGAIGKLFLIIIFFTAYALLQYYFCNTFFDKAQFSIKGLIDNSQREPHLTGMFSFLRGTIMRAKPQLDPYGIFFYKGIGMDLFVYYYNNSLKTERDILADYQVMGNYYPDFLSVIDGLGTPQVCQKASELIPNFNVYGCMNDLNGLGGAGIKKTISIMSENWYKNYYSFLAEKNKTDPNVVARYFQDPALFDACKYLLLSI